MINKLRTSLFTHAFICVFPEFEKLYSHLRKTKPTLKSRLSAKYLPLASLRPPPWVAHAWTKNLMRWLKEKNAKFHCTKTSTNTTQQSMIG